MCGIGGILGKIEKSVALSKLQIIGETQVNRGPDSLGIFQDEFANLVHNRLSIIDLSDSGNQPMESENFVLIFNGEIYNFLELKSQLISQGVQFNGTSDTEVLLKLLEKYGINKAIELINGIFSFCAYNKKSGESYLVRDRMGEKPLFYFIDNDILYFASNPAAIVNCLPEVEWILDKDGMWEYFIMGGIFSSRTLIKNISRLDSACILTKKLDSISIDRYWTPQYKSGITVSQIENSIRDAVKSRTVSDVPIVLFLSGGVDSTSVAAILKNIDAAHLISEEETIARKVANQFNMNFTLVEPTDFNIESILLEYSAFSGEATMSGFIPFIVSREISDKYKVAISANGADELFFGYTRTPTPLINPSFFKQRLQKKSININAISSNELGQIYHIFRKTDSFVLPFSEDSKNEKDLFDLIDSQLEYFNVDQKFPASSKFRWLELMTYVKGDLNNTLDFASMANSVEVRAPFLDYKLVELALSLDERQHISSKNGRKHFLKEILKKEGIDSSIWDRNKLGFSLISSYLTKIQSLKDKAIAELKQENLFEISDKCSPGSRDFSYLQSAALGFYYWKKVWIDSGKIKKS